MSNKLKWGYQLSRSVNNATLNRFFALHFVLPFVLAALALMHLIVLHENAGSGNPLGVSGNYDRLPFAPYYIFKDLITIFIFILILSLFVFFMPNLLGDSENYVMANPMQTPPAIVPEWYLLPFYAILRSIPNKLLGVIAMFSAILILLVMPFTDLSRSRGIQFKPLSKAAFFIFVGNFLILMELGAKHVESPFIEFGQICTVLYFAHFLIIVPLISLLENSLIELTSVEIEDYINEMPVVMISGFNPDYIPNPNHLRKPGQGSAYVIWKKEKDKNKKNGKDNDGDGDGGAGNLFPDLIPNPNSISVKPVKPDKPKIRTIAILGVLILFLISLTIGLYLLDLKTVTSGFTPEVLHCDAPRPWGMYFQDSATPQMEALVELHDNILFYLVIILFGVGWLLISIVKNYSNTEAPISHKHQSHGTLIELIWTITPALILILIAFPSFKLLYLMDEVSDPSMAVLAEGFFIRGLKLHILNKIKDTSLMVWLAVSNRAGEKNNTLVFRLAQVQDTSFLLRLHNTSITTHKKQNFTAFSTKLITFNKRFHTKVKAFNRIGPHNEEVISVLIGSLLGDCYSSVRNIEGVRFSYKQSQVHKDYLFWLYEFYYKRGYCSNLKPRMYTGILRDKRSNGIKEYYGYEFNTFTFRSFNWIYKLFYKKGTKTVSVKLEQYLTPLALAIWIMDDGCWAKPGIIISSNNFKLEEVQILANLLKKLFNLNCTVQKIKTPGQYSIYIRGESVLNLRKLILPHVIPSMRYKLGL